MHVLGLSMDYGQYAFIEDWDPEYLCSFRDREGIYSFDNQPSMCEWTLMKLAQALDPIVPKS